MPVQQEKRLWDLDAIISSHIDNNIFASVKVGSKIYDDVQIADAYIKGELVLRSRVMKIGDDENYFCSKGAEVVGTPDMLPFWGLYIVKHMLRSAEKSKNCLYENKAHDILVNFIAAVENDPGKLADTELAAFNRALIFCYAYRWFAQKEDPFTQTLRDFMRMYLMKTLDVSDRSSYTFRASMCAVRLLTMALLSVDDVSDCIEKMLRCTGRYLNQDGTSTDGIIQSNAYFHRFFSLFMDVMQLIGKNDDRLSALYSAQVRFLQLVTSTNGFFPALGEGNSVRSTFHAVPGDQVFPVGGVNIINKEDALWISRADSCGASIFYDHGGRAVFLEHAAQQEQKIVSGLQMIRSENSAVKVDFRPSLTSVELGAKSGYLSAEYRYENIEFGFQCLCDYRDISGGVKHSFILSSQSREVQFSQNTVSFFSGGKHIALNVRCEGNFSVGFQTAMGTEEGASVSVQVVEICFPAESGHFEIDVCIDWEEYIRYKQSRGDFLPERAYRQVKSIAYSDFMDQLVRYGNIGATEIYRLGRQAYLEHDFETAKRCEILNSVLHNCAIKSSCRLGEGTRLAYGGIGVLVHAQSTTGKYCMIGVGASLASAVALGDYVYVAPGVRFPKRIHVGSFSIIGANAVVNKDVEPFSIVAGVPAKVIGNVTPENLDKYLVDYFAATGKTDPAFVESVRQEFLAQYELWEKQQNKKS